MANKQGPKSKTVQKVNAPKKTRVFAFRADDELASVLESMATTEERSVGAQICYLLRRALKEAA